MPQDSAKVALHYTGQPQVAVDEDKQKVVLKYPNKGYTPPISPIQISGRGEHVYEDSRVCVRTPENMKLSVYEDPDGATRCSISPECVRGAQGEINISIAEEKEKPRQTETKKLIIEPCCLDPCIDPCCHHMHGTTTTLQLSTKKTNLCKKCGKPKAEPCPFQEQTDTKAILPDFICEHCLRHGHIVIDTGKRSRSRTPDSKSSRSQTPESKLDRRRTPERRAGRSRTPESRKGRARTPESRSQRRRTPESEARRPRTTETKLVKRTCCCGKVIYEHVPITTEETTKDVESQVEEANFVCQACQALKTARHTQDEIEIEDEPEVPPALDKFEEHPCHHPKHHVTCLYTPPPPPPPPAPPQPPTSQREKIEHPCYHCKHPVKCNYDPTRWPNQEEIDAAQPICTATKSKYKAIKEMKEQQPKSDPFTSLLYEDINFAETIFKRCKRCNNTFSFRPTSKMRCDLEMPTLCDECCGKPAPPVQYTVPHHHHFIHHHPPPPDPPPPHHHHDFHEYHLDHHHHHELPPPPEPREPHHHHHHHHEFQPPDPRDSQPPPPPPPPAPFPPHHHHHDPHHHECYKPCGCRKQVVCEHCRGEKQTDMALSGAQDFPKITDPVGRKTYTFETPLGGDKKNPNAPTVVGNVSVDLALCWDPTCKHRNKQNKELVGGSIAQTTPYPLDFDLNIDIPPGSYPKIDQVFDDDSVCETCVYSESTDTANYKERDEKIEPYRHLYSYPQSNPDEHPEEDNVIIIRETEDASTETKDANLVDMATSPDSMEEEIEQVVEEIPTDEKSMQVNIDEEERKAKELIDNAKPKKSPLKNMLCCGSKKGK